MIASNNGQLSTTLAKTNLTNTAITLLDRHATTARMITRLTLIRSKLRDTTAVAGA
jgi:hypothetical protein